MLFGGDGRCSFAAAALNGEPVVASIGDREFAENGGASTVVLAPASPRVNAGAMLCCEGCSRFAAFPLAPCLLRLASPSLISGLAVTDVSVPEGGSPGSI